MRDPNLDGVDHIKTFKCSKCDGACKYIKYNSVHDCEEYICDSCGIKILVPGSTWD